MREKVRFEPGKEIEKDVFSSFHECETKEKESRQGIEPQTFGAPPLSHRNSTASEPIRKFIHETRPACLHNCLSYSIYKRDGSDIADPNSTQAACLT